MASDASHSAPVIETSFKSAMLHMISLEASEQLGHVLFARAVKLLLVRFNIRLLVLFRYDDGPVRLSLSKLLPRGLNMIEQLLQIAVGTYVLNRHGRLITEQDRYMKGGVLFPELVRIDEIRAQFFSRNTFTPVFIDDLIVFWLTVKV